MGPRAGENARSCHAFHHSIVDACAGLAMLLWALVSAEIRVGAMKKDVYLAVGDCLLQDMMIH